MVKTKEYMRKYRARINGAAGGNASPAPYNFGASSDAGADVKEMFRRAGVDQIQGMDDVLPAVAGAYAIQLGNLEREYHAIDDIKNAIADKDFSFSMEDLPQGVNGEARFSYSDNIMNKGKIHPVSAKILLDKATATDIKTFGNLAWLSEHFGSKYPEISTVQNSNNPHVKADLLSRVRYTVTHEYGHQLENALFIRARADGYIGTSREYRAMVKREINKLAGMPASSAPTNYGGTSGGEFFAEAFTGAILGGSDSHSVAMRQWLRNQGY